MTGPRLPYGSWEHSLSRDTPPPVHPVVTEHGLKLSSRQALEELQTDGGCVGRLGQRGAGWGTTHMGPPAHARRSKRGQPHRDRGKVERGDGVCAARLALGPEADGVGVMAHRGGGGKSGPGAGEGAGCPLPAEGSTPSYLPHRNLVQGGFSAVGTGLLGGLGSVRDLGVGRQSTFTTPVGLPEAPVQLLQL